MKKIFFILLLSGLITSCTKSGSNPEKEKEKSRTDLLINKKWKIAAMGATLEDGSKIEDSYSSFRDYEKDDYYYFKPDLTFTLNANTLKKPGETKEILDAGTWKLINNDTYLELKSTIQSPPGQTTSYYPTKILELTETKLSLEVYTDYGVTSRPIFIVIQ